MANSRGSASTFVFLHICGFEQRCYSSLASTDCYMPRPCERTSCTPSHRPLSSPRPPPVGEIEFPGLPQKRCSFQIWFTARSPFEIVGFVMSRGGCCKFVLRSRRPVRPPRFSLHCRLVSFGIPLRPTWHLYLMSRSILLAPGVGVVRESDCFRAASIRRSSYTALVKDSLLRRIAGFESVRAFLFAVERNRVTNRLNFE